MFMFNFTAMNNESFVNKVFTVYFLQIVDIF